MEMNILQTVKTCIFSNFYFNIVNSRWKVLLPPTEASNKVYDISASIPSGETITISDVLFGDVWFCSGQSNMEMVLNQDRNGKETMAEAGNYTQIRLLTVSRGWDINNTVDDLSISEYRQLWSVNSPSALNGGSSFSYFSSVCYYFGLELHKTLHIPIGLVSSAFGGSLIEAWSPPSVINSCTNIAWEGNNEGNKHPGAFYNKMIHPFLNMTIKGMIWYQGEENVKFNSGNIRRNDGYGCLFTHFIEEYRRLWSIIPGTTSSNFPFGFVQLSGYCPGPNHLCNNDIGVGTLRFVQTAEQGVVPNKYLPNTFMAMSIDLQDPYSPSGEIHPGYKKIIGERLSLGALRYAYGLNTYPNGPSYQSCEILGDLLVVNLTRSLMNEDPIEIRHDYGFEVNIMNSTSSDVWKKVPIVDSKGVSVYVDVKGINNIVGLRYIWGDNACCPESYDGKSGFSCDILNCPLYGKNSQLPTPGFISQIVNGVCVL